MTDPFLTSDALVLAYVYDELSADARRAFEERLQADAELTAEVEGLVAMRAVFGEDARYGDDSGLDEPPPHLFDAILKDEQIARSPAVKAAVVRRSAPKPDGFLGRLSTWFVGGGALVGAAALVIFVVTQGPGIQDAAPPTSKTAGLPSATTATPAPIQGELAADTGDGFNSANARDAARGGEADEDDRGVAPSEGLQEEKRMRDPMQDTPAVKAPSAKRSSARRNKLSKKKNAGGRFEGGLLNKELASAKDRQPEGSKSGRRISSGSVVEAPREPERQAFGTAELSDKSKETHKGQGSFDFKSSLDDDSIGTRTGTASGGGGSGGTRGLGGNLRGADSSGRNAAVMDSLSIGDEVPRAEPIRNEAPKKPAPRSVATPAIKRESKRDSNRFDAPADLERTFEAEEEAPPPPPATTSGPPALSQAAKSVARKQRQVATEKAKKRAKPRSRSKVGASSKSVGDLKAAAARETRLRRVEDTMMSGARELDAGRYYDSLSLFQRAEIEARGLPEMGLGPVVGQMQSLERMNRKRDALQLVHKALRSSRKTKGRADVILTGAKLADELGNRTLAKTCWSQLLTTPYKKQAQRALAERSKKLYRANESFDAAESDAPASAAPTRR